MRFADLLSFVQAEAEAADESTSFHPVVPASVGSRVCCLLVDGDPAARVPDTGSLDAGDVTVEVAFKAINTDGSGEISWQEWCVMADALLSAVPPAPTQRAQVAAHGSAEAPATPAAGSHPSPARVAPAPQGSQAPSPAPARGSGQGTPRASAIRQQQGTAGVSPLRGAADAQLYDVMSMPSQRARRHDVWSQLFDCVHGAASEVVPFDDLAHVVEAVAAGSDEGDDGAAELVQWFARVLALTQVWACVATRVLPCLACVPWFVA